MTDELGTTELAPETTISTPADTAPAPADTVPAGDDMPSAPRDEVKTRSIAEAIRRAQQKIMTGEETGRAERPRDQQGRFVSGQYADAKAQQAEQQPSGEAEQARRPASDAPSRFSADARAAWTATPEPVKAEINRAMRELETGLQQYQARFEPLRRFFQLAEQHGTTVEQALDNYTRIDFALREDPDSVLPEIFRVANLDPRQWAARILGQQPAQGQPDQQAAAYERHIQALNARIQQLEQSVSGVSSQIEQQQQAEIMAEIRAFAAEHPRFDELRDSIGQLLQSGIATDLADAYQKADRLNPAVAAKAQASAPSPPPQTQRRPSPQISGAPASGSNPGTRPAAKTIREAIESAMTRVR